MKAELFGELHEQKLFELLIKFGFEKQEDDTKIIFKNGDEIFVYPKTELSINHYYATRHHLDWNGWMTKDEFNLVFKL
jgi:hypothetical protein